MPEHRRYVLGGQLGEIVLHLVTRIRTLEQDLAEARRLGRDMAEAIERQWAAERHLREVESRHELERARERTFGAWLH